MADAELHIIIKQAGDPEKLGALLNAALELKERPVRTVIPTGYKCIECYRDDGGHDPMCSMRLADLTNRGPGPDAERTSEPTPVIGSVP